MVLIFLFLRSVANSLFIEEKILWKNIEYGEWVIQYEEVITPKIKNIPIQLDIRGILAVGSKMENRLFIIFN
jgi:hypothetical protein